MVNRFPVRPGRLHRRQPTDRADKRTSGNVRPFEAGSHQGEIAEFRNSAIILRQRAQRVVRSLGNNTREHGRAFLAEAARIPVRTPIETLALEEANDALIALKPGALRGAGCCRGRACHRRQSPITSARLMPIYEYICKDCDKQFELLIRESTVLECPSCKSRKLEKQLSVFAVSSDSGSAMKNLPEACRSCNNPGGPGACAMRQGG
jgi:putative FmdB family regulatory protein